MLSITKDVNVNKLKENKSVYNYFDLVCKLSKNRIPYEMSVGNRIEPKLENEKDNVLYFGQIDEIGKNINFRN